MDVDQIVDPWTDDGEDIFGGRRPSVEEHARAIPWVERALFEAAMLRAFGASEEEIERRIVDAAGRKGVKL